MNSVNMFMFTFDRSVRVPHGRKLTGLLSAGFCAFSGFCREGDGDGRAGLGLGGKGDG